jgi:hypothetical protein
VEDDGDGDGEIHGRRREWRQFPLEKRVKAPNYRLIKAGIATIPDMETLRDCVAYDNANQNRIQVLRRLQWRAEELRSHEIWPEAKPQDEGLDIKYEGPGPADFENAACIECGANVWRTRRRPYAPNTIPAQFVETASTSATSATVIETTWRNSSTRGAFNCHHREFTF